MIILESINLLCGPNVLPENAKIIANWVEYDDDTGEQLNYGVQEIWYIPKDFMSDEFWEGRPADLKDGDIKRWKNLDPQVKNVANTLFGHITRVVEDAVTAGDIEPIKTKSVPANKPQWLIDLQGGS